MKYIIFIIGVIAFVIVALGVFGIQVIGIFITWLNKIWSNRYKIICNVIGHKDIYAGDLETSTLSYVSYSGAKLVIKCKRCNRIKHVFTIDDP